MTLREACKRALGVACVCGATTSAAEAPESIVGTWRADMNRTMQEMLSEFAATQRRALAERQAPEGNGGFLLGDMSSSKQAPMPPPTPSADPTITVTITDETMTWETPNQPTKTFSYKVTGGNAALVHLELIDEEGKQTAGSVRLIEGGLAMDLPGGECPPPKPAGDDPFTSGDLAETTAAEPPRCQALKVLYFKPAD